MNFAEAKYLLIGTISGLALQCTTMCEEGCDEIDCRLYPQANEFGLDLSDSGAHAVDFDVGTDAEGCRKELGEDAPKGGQVGFGPGDSAEE